MSKMNWVFNTYPTTDDTVLVKLTNGILMTLKWDTEKKIWKDVVTEDFVDCEVACWTSVVAPDIVTPMPNP